MDVAVIGSGLSGFAAVHALLAQNSDPKDEEIRAALSGNLCRCTGYNQMYEAIKAAIEAEQKAEYLGRETIDTLQNERGNRDVGDAGCKGKAGGERIADEAAISNQIAESTKCS